MRIAIPLNRQGEARCEAFTRSEQAGVEQVHECPQFIEPVLDRRARYRDPH